MPSIRSFIPSLTVLVIGDVMLDRYRWGRVERLSPEAPVPVVRVLERTTALGGAGNVAANVVGLGCRAVLAGCVGADAAGRRIRALVAEQGIVDELVTDAGRPSTTKTRIMAQGCQLLRLDDEYCGPLTDTLRRAVALRAAPHLAAARAVILSDYDKGVVQSPGFAQSIVEGCRRHRIPLLVDPKGDNWECYRGATCLTPNIHELALLTGEAPEPLEKRLATVAATVRRTYDLDWLLVTRGAQGMLLTGRDGPPEIIAATTRDTFDVCGAGDTVIAVLAAAVAGGWQFDAAARLANRAAGIVVGKLGTCPIRLDELVPAAPAGLAAASRPASAKIVSLDTARTRVEAWRRSGDTIVFTNGCFDLLHAGHAHLLHQARREGQRMVVGLNSDGSVRRLKGRQRPILPEAQRGLILGALEAVDLVVVFEEDTPLDLLYALRPDVLVKGADYRPVEVVGREWVESYGGRVHLVPLVEGVSSSRLIDRIVAGRLQN